MKEVTLDTGEKVRVVGPPVEYSGSYNAVRSPPPSLGQHTITVLRDLLNYSDEKINNMIKNGDIQ